MFALSDDSQDHDPSYFENYSSYIVAYGLGIQISDAVGPIFGGVLFKHLGYIGVFSLQSALCFLSAFLMLCFVGKPTRSPVLPLSQSSTLSIGSILLVPVRQASAQGVLFGFMAQVLSECFYISIAPIMPLKLFGEFGMDEHAIGLFFLHFTAAVVLATFFLLCVSHRTNKLFFILPGFFSLTLGAFITGPSRPSVSPTS